MRKRLLLFAFFVTLGTQVSVAEQLWVGQTYQCFLEDYANKYYDWVNISWSVDNGLYENYYGSYVRTVSFDEYKSGTYNVTVNWTETDLSDPFDPLRHKSHTWSFTCRDNPLVLSPTSTSLSVGETKQLSCSFTYSNNYTQSISYSSSNTDVATVSSSGLITAKGEGTATIKASSVSSRYDETCTVTVTSPDPTGITVSPGSYRLAIGETKTLSYTLTPSGATADVTWRSAATSVATVSSSSGTVTGISEGTARIWAETSNGLSDYCDITVYKVVPTSIQLSPSSCTLAVGSKKQLSYTVSPSNAEYTVSFKSSQPSVASVTSKGEVTALSGGQTTITVTTDNGCSSECIVTVPPQPRAACA